MSEMAFSSDICYFKENEESEEHSFLFGSLFCWLSYTALF